MKILYQNYILISISCFFIYDISRRILFSTMMVGPVFGIENFWGFRVPIILAIHAIFLAPIIMYWKVEAKQREVYLKRLKYISIFITAATYAFMHISFHTRSWDREGWARAIFLSVVIFLFLALLAAKAIAKDSISDINNNRIKKDKELILPHKFINSFISPPFYIALIIWSGLMVVDIIQNIVN